MLKLSVFLLASMHLIEAAHAQTAGGGRSDTFAAMIPLIILLLIIFGAIAWLIRSTRR